MKIIALDTSGSILIGGILEDKRFIAGIQLKGIRHSQNLVPVLQELLSRFRMDITDIDTICVGIGPGSFTGLRIGIGTVKGLVYAQNFNLIPLCSLTIIAYNALYFKGRVWVVVDAKKQSVYIRGFSSDGKGSIRPQGVVKLLKPPDVIRLIKKPDLIIGDAISVYGKVFQKKAILCNKEIMWYPAISGLCLYSIDMLKRNKFISSDKLVPKYIFASDVQVSTNTVR
jgi:tRNA threonylcarbamoyladenosine biosynthesis protein TsaB